MHSFHRSLSVLYSHAFLLVSGSLIAAGAATGAEPNEPPDARAAENALSGLDAHDGVSVTLFAAEPMIRSISNMDIDHRGRVWVCDVVNYRGRNGERAEGDRIVILEDTDGDGQAEEHKVYYQGRDIDSALGICVLGNKTIVSCSPNIFVFTDEDGDDEPDRKELLFTNTGDEQHDHSAHAFVFGPDGKFYWNFGNTGKGVSDAEGRRVIDMAGNEVVDNGRPYFGGMVFRCDPDGSNFEVLAHNFRNNYEVAVDAFGTLWQSDNDDDGNRAVRINYVMEYGNYGYRDEMTGAGWRTPRVGMRPDVPHRHWHVNDPGVVPNLLLTGAGSPTGICIYEGRLLPEVFWDQMIHADAGPNVVRAYPVTNDGAGYRATMVDTVHGARDQWFRPSDVCIAPDGSLFIADWYDPGVGGHQMGDIDRGRILRIAPPDTPYQVAKVDFADPAEAVAALCNPAQSVRYLAWQALAGSLADAQPHVERLLESDNPRHRARALWLLARLPNLGEFYAQSAVDDSDSDIRIQGLRIARQRSLEVARFVKQLIDDVSPQVRRECAIALRACDSDEAADLWAQLALQHDGQDRWYLEALGIAADGRWDACFDAWLTRIGDDWNTPAGRDIIWRSRAAKSVDYLAQLLDDPDLPADEVPRLVRAFDFVPHQGRNDALARLVFDRHMRNERDRLIAAEAIRRLEGFDLDERPDFRAALARVLKAVRGSTDFVELVEKFEVAEQYPELLALAQSRPSDAVGVRAMRTLLAKQRDLIHAALEEPDPQVARDTLLALGNSSDGRAVPLLLQLMNDSKRETELRREAVRALAKSRNGARRLIELAGAADFDAALVQAAAAALHAAPFNDVKSQAAQRFPLPAARNNETVPPIAELLNREGDATRGKNVFLTTGTCTTCHIVGGDGKEVGPNLSEIGGKLSRQALFESILFPSAGIGQNYETHLVVLGSGNVLSGIISSRTAEEVTIIGADAIPRTIATSEIDEIEQQDVSLMPADLQKLITAEELVDVVEYMTTLRKGGAASQ